MTKAIVVRIEGDYVITAQGADLLSAIAGQASDAKDEAVAAASVALAAGGVGEYPDTGAGLSGTTEGETFWVDLGDGTGQVYRHDPGPTATPLQKFIIDPTDPGAADIFAGGVPTLAALDSSTGAVMVGLGDTTVAASIPPTPQQYGSSPSSDSATALSDAATAAAGADGVLVINGVVRVDTAITLPSNLKVSGNGIIDLSNATPATVDGIERVIAIGGGVTQIADLSTDIDLFGTTATFVDPHGLSVNDVFAVWNPTDYSQAPFRPEYRAGDMFRVAEVISTTQVRFFGVSKSLYDKDDVEVYKLNGGSLAWDGVKIIPPASGIPLLLDGLIDVNFTRPFVETGAVGAAIEVHRCYGVSTVDPSITVLDGSDLYPIIISNSQNVVIQAVNNIYSGWHCIALGGRDGAATVPTADVLISGVVAKNDGSSGVGAVEIHGGCKRIAYDNCLVDVANISGEDVSFRNCQIYGRPPELFADGNCIYGSEVVGGTYTIENCVFITAGNGENFASMLDLDVSRVIRDFYLVIRNATVRNIASSAEASASTLIRLGAGSSSPPAAAIDVTVDGMLFIGDAPPLVAVGVSGTNDIGANLTVRMSNISGVERLYAASLAANYDISFFGPGSRPGAASVGDASVSLDRLSVEHQVFDTALTADRFCDLPPVGIAVQGDTFVVTRTGSGNDSNVVVRSGTSPRLAALAPGDWVRVGFKGTGDNGSWVVVARGSVFALDGVKTFGDVSAFIELTRTSQTFGRQTNIWNTPLTADRSALFDGGALPGDRLRFVRTAAATGAFNLTVGTGPIKALAAGQWCEITYDGSAWVLTAFGSL